MQRRGRAIGVDVALTTLALVFSGLVPLGFNLIVGRRYGPAVLGEVSVVLGLALFLGQIPGALTIAATKFLAEALGRGEEDTARAIFHFLLAMSGGLGVVLAAGLTAAAPLVAPALHVHVSTVLQAAGLVLAYTLYLFFKSAYYGTQRVGRYVGNEIVSDVLFFVLLALVLLVHATPWLLLPFVLNNAIFVARAAHDLAPYVRHFDWGRAAPRRAIVRYCTLAGAGSIASMGRSALSTTVAGLFLSHHAVGLYAAASALTNPLYLLPQALTLVLFAAMARLHGAGQAASVRDLLQRSTQWLVLALGVVCGLVVINAHRRPRPSSSLCAAPISP
jgi:O-antigen/teichoic acid export membrane protein